MCLLFLTIVHWPDNIEGLSLCRWNPSHMKLLTCCLCPSQICWIPNIWSVVGLNIQLLEIEKFLHVSFVCLLVISNLSSVMFSVGMFPPGRSWLSNTSVETYQHRISIGSGVQICDTRLWGVGMYGVRGRPSGNATKRWLPKKKIEKPIKLYGISWNYYWPQIQNLGDLQTSEKAIKQLI